MSVSGTCEWPWHTLEPDRPSLLLSRAMYVCEGLAIVGGVESTIASAKERTGRVRWRESLSRSLDWRKSSEAP